MNTDVFIIAPIDAQTILPLAPCVPVRAAVNHLETFLYFLSLLQRSAWMSLVPPCLSLTSYLFLFL